MLSYDEEGHHIAQTLNDLLSQAKVNKQAAGAEARAGQWPRVFMWLQGISVFNLSFYFLFY